MNYFTRHKWMTILIVVLLIANTATLFAYWFLKERNTSRMPPVRPGRAASFISHELEFTKEQQQQFETLKREHQQGVEVYRDSLREAKDKLFSLLQNKEATETDVDAAAKHAAYYQEQIDLLTFSHFKKVKAICTPRQQEKFDEIIQEVLRQMAPPPPPPPPAGSNEDDRDNRPLPPPPARENQ